MTPEKRRRKLLEEMRKPYEGLTGTAKILETGQNLPTLLEFKKGLMIGCNRPDPNVDLSNRSE